MVSAYVFSRGDQRAAAFVWDLNIADYLSFVALVLTLIEVWRTRKIARKTQQAIEHAAARVSLYNVLLAVPELSRLETELENAAVLDDRNEARRILAQWRDSAADLRGLLRNEGVSNTEVEEAVQNSITQASIAQRELAEKKSGTVLGRTEKAREAVQATCSQSRSLAATIRSSATAIGSEPASGVTPKSEARKPKTGAS